MTKNTPTPFDRMSRTVCVIAEMKSFDASVNSRCASSKKNTSFGLSRSPTSGRISNSSASRYIRNVENSAGLSATPGHLEQADDAATVGRGAQEVRTSNSGSPKKTSAPPSANVMSSRRITPAVAAERPPSSFSSALPSSLVR